MKPTIYLALVDDWELRGDGSGKIEQIQFRPMRELVAIYNKYGIRGSFNAEVMQQMAYRKFQVEFKELKDIADTWDNIILETYRQGHDIQLHIHPQWFNAQYQDGDWLLTADWSILNHPPKQAYQMIATGKNYLEKLLRSVNPEYRCVSFRSGAWCIAPSPYIMQMLTDLGIILDISIVAGARFHTRNIQLDYSSCEEGFLPYFPRIDDARKVATTDQKLICVPTNHFYINRWFIIKQLIHKIAAKVQIKRHSSKAQPAINNYHEWVALSEKKLWGRLSTKFSYFIKGYQHYVSDLAQLDYPLLCEMMRQIRRKAERTGLSEIPIVLENHTKDLVDFSHIDRFIRDLANSDDIRCITLTELASKLVNREFAIMKKVNQDE